MRTVLNWFFNCSLQVVVTMATPCLERVFKTGSECEASLHTCQETAAESSARAPVGKC